MTKQSQQPGLTGAKPMGPVPHWFKADEDGSLLIGGKRASALVDEAGDTPLFVYDSAIVADKIAEFRQHMPAEVALHYAVKANPLLSLVRWMIPQVDGLDIASGGELEMVIAAGADPAQVSFAGPGKRDDELAAALSAGVTINLESHREFTRILTLAEKSGQTPHVAIRVNPDFELKASGMRMGGGAKPFGVDVDQVPALLDAIKNSTAVFKGFHIFSGSQNLDAEALIEAQGKTIELAARLADVSGMEPPLVNLGGGLGIPYFPGDEAVDSARIGEALAQRLAALPSSLQSSRFAIELGRWLVGESGVYLTRIVDRKISAGHTFLVCDGGMHHQLAVSGNFGQVVRRNYPVANAQRFLATPTEVATIVGCLCTPLDRLGDQVALPESDEGDLIAVFLAGAYGASASPSAFLGHSPAKELLLV